MSETVGLWPPPGPRSVVLVIRDTSGDESRRVACSKLSDLLRRTDAEVVSVETLGVRPVDLGLVDLLARLAVLARRGGMGIRLRRPAPGLSDLLSLSGLSDVAPR